MLAIKLWFTHQKQFPLFWHLKYFKYGQIESIVYCICKMRQNIDKFCYTHTLYQSLLYGHITTLALIIFYRCNNNNQSIIWIWIILIYAYSEPIHIMCVCVWVSMICCIYVKCSKPKDHTWCDWCRILYGIRLYAIIIHSLTHSFTYSHFVIYIYGIGSTWIKLKCMYAMYALNHIEVCMKLQLQKLNWKSILHTSKWLTHRLSS